MKNLLLDPDVMENIDTLIRNGLETAESYFGKYFIYPTVDYDLKGKTGGRAYLQQNRISLNPVLLHENQHLFVKEVVPHELAHLIAHQVYGSNIKAHGNEWKSVMHLLGATPNRTHKFDTSNAAVKVQRRWKYKCLCRTHLLSTTRHNKMLKSGGFAYLCRVCRQPLVQL